MTSADRRIRKATARLAMWSNAANNARAMGAAKWTHGRGAVLVSLMELSYNRRRNPLHSPLCRCEECVIAWEKTAEDIEFAAKYAGIDPKRHTFGAIRSTTR